MTAILVVAAPRKALRHGTWTTAPESRYTAGWYGAIGWLQMRQTLTSTWAPSPRRRQFENRFVKKLLTVCPTPTAPSRA